MANNNKSKDNAALEKTLIEYCTGEVAPDYALMLHGPWGNGKSFFVDRFIKDRLKSKMGDSEGQTPPVVSLYGVASAQDFADALYIALHPLLLHPGMRLAGAVMKGLLKGALKIELTDDKSKSLTLNIPGIPDLGRKKTKDRILFFDDFERAHMSGAEVLGLINPLVASGENRIVIIANEDEIDKKDDDAREKYRLAKEKTIGFTLTVQQELEKVYEFFSEDFSDENYRKFLKASDSAVQSVMQAAQSPNLRVLRIALQSFYKIFECIPEFQTEKYFQPLSEMLQVVLVAFLQTRTQDTDIEVFKSRGMLSGSVTKRFTDEKRKKHDKAAQALRSRFSFVRFYLQCLSYNMLEALVCRSAVDTDLVHKTLLRDIRFQSVDNIPSWLVVLDGRYSDDAAFECSLKRFKEDFDNRVFQGAESILYTFQCYIHLCDLKEEGFEDTQPAESIKKYIDDVYKNKEYSDNDKNFLSTMHENRDFFTQSSLRRDNVSFKDVKFYLRQAHQKFLSDIFRTKAEDFLKNEVFDRNIFDDLLELKTPGKNEYFPIFNGMEPEDFAEKLTLLVPDDYLCIMSGLHSRYTNNEQPFSMLEEQKNWLKAMLAALEEKIQSKRSLRREGYQLLIDALRRDVLSEEATNASNPAP